MEHETAHISGEETVRVAEFLLEFLVDRPLDLLLEQVIRLEVLLGVTVLDVIATLLDATVYLLDLECLEPLLLRLVIERLSRPLGEVVVTQLLFQ